MKLKLTDLNSGQESLLLVTKVNAKGLLVQAAQTLPLGTPVHLSFTLEEGSAPLELKGEIYKIAERTSGQKGMVIKFTKPTPSQLKTIQDYVNKLETSPGESQEYDGAPSENRTMVVTEDTLSKLSFAPPKKKSKKDRAVSSTVDEERAPSNYAEFAEETRLVAKAEFESFVRKEKRGGFGGWALFIFALVGIIAVALVFLFKNSSRVKDVLVSASSPSPTAIPSPLPLTPTSKPAQEQKRTSEEEEEALNPVKTFSPVPKQPAPKPTQPPKEVPSELKKVSVEETAAFVKVTLIGPGVDRPELSRLMNPRRLSVDLKRVKNFTNEGTMIVGKNPLLRIRTMKNAGFVQVLFDLYPVDFPRYDVKDSAEGVNIYLYR